MKFRSFGRSSRKINVVGQGTWDLEQAERRQAIAALQHGLDLGMTHIDTAEMYGNGKVEELVGEAIGNRRNEVFLVTKVLPENASRKSTIRSCEQSLRRLRTDRIDCYLLHWRGKHPLADTFAAFEQLLNEGKILSWGVSNFDEPDLNEALDIIGDLDQSRLVCNQVLYHLKERAIEHAVIPWCQEHEVAVVAYSPFGSGDFPDLRTREGRVLSEVADSHKATPRQVALSFLLRHSLMFAIPKSAKSEHVAENAKAAELQLTLDEISRIETAFPLGPRPKELPTI
jgi:diketogulonate reductase-like aldo/keto reductase